MRTAVLVGLVLLMLTHVVSASYYNNSSVSWMKVDLNYHEISGINWVGIPGILYDHNNQVIDSSKDLGAYTVFLGLDINNFAMWNSCTQTIQSLSWTGTRWVGTDFEIYPGMGLRIVINSDCTLPLNFSCESLNHSICDDLYCEINFGNVSLSLETVDPLEGVPEIALLFMFMFGMFYFRSNILLHVSGLFYSLWFYSTQIDHSQDYAYFLTVAFFCVWVGFIFIIYERSSYVWKKKKS